MKILILGYSKIVRKRVLNVLKKKKFKIFVASKTFKEKIPGVNKQYKSYEVAIKNCKPNLIYISLPNSKHYFWAKKSLIAKCNTVVDKPITCTKKQLDNLINLSKRKKKLLAEATYYNYHSQIRKIKNIYKRDKFKFINAKFIIPTPDKKSILLSKKLKGGALMDMGPYISSIPRIFELKTIINKNVKVKKNNNNLIIFLKFQINYKEGKYNGIFQFGGKYRNEILIKNQYKNYMIKRAFSPPDNENLFLYNIKNNKNKKSIKFRKQNCFKNFFNEVIKNIKLKKYDFYYPRMKQDCYFRYDLIK
ncbi:Gfo/Idh/MocA family oxidoreductase [Candidatus Pelagibacter sp.]|nr:Gfo/Idh/MocA family oxidoreductase [Candidatus Pelagibacter sp.]